MISLRQALDAAIRGNPLLEFGFRHDLFNLTRLAGYLRPLVAARAKKDVQESALTMALSRLRREYDKAVPIVERFEIENVAIHSGLAVRTYARSPRVLKRLNEFYLRLHDANAFCSLTHGMHELTIIFDARHRAALNDSLADRPLHENIGVAAISVRFDTRYVDVPGLLYLLTQRVTLQNVNLIEISSTYTETMLFVAERDARLVFDTIFESFLVRAGD